MPKWFPKKKWKSWLHLLTRLVRRCLVLKKILLNYSKKKEFLQKWSPKSPRFGQRIGLPTKHGKNSGFMESRRPKKEITKIIWIFQRNVRDVALKTRIKSADLALHCAKRVTNATIVWSLLIILNAIKLIWKCADLKIWKWIIENSH